DSAPVSPRVLLLPATRIRHRVVEGARGLPAEPLARERWVGGRDGRVAGASLDDLDRQLTTDDAFEGAQHVEHRAADAGAEVDGEHAGLERLERGDVALGEIHHVDVVA